LQLFVPAPHRAKARHSSGTSASVIECERIKMACAESLSS
jgi:hypothetical protein